MHLLSHWYSPIISVFKFVVFAIIITIIFHIIALRLCVVQMLHETLFSHVKNEAQSFAITHILHNTTISSKMRKEQKFNAILPHPICRIENSWSLWNWGSVELGSKRDGRQYQGLVCHCVVEVTDNEGIQYSSERQN